MVGLTSTTLSITTKLHVLNDNIYEIEVEDFLLVTLKKGLK